MSGRALLSALGALCVAHASPATAHDNSDAAARAEWVTTCKDWDEWDKPAPPFRVYGNTYYVGTCGISSILIVTNQGDILIDGGPANAGGLVASNIRKLGFVLSDVKLLLHSHEHHDHVGGLAELQRLTGSDLFASEVATLVLTSGMAGSDDPQFGEHNSFPPARVTRTIHDQATIDIADLELLAIATPGHTPGALSWYWKSCEAAVCKTIVYADSLTPVSSDDYRFSDHPAYLAEFRASLDKVAALDCDILLAPHPSAAGMRDRLLKGDLTGPPNCKDYAESLRKRLDERIAKETAGAKP